MEIVDGGFEDHFPEFEVPEEVAETACGQRGPFSVATERFIPVVDRPRRNPVCLGRQLSDRGKTDGVMVGEDTSRLYLRIRSAVGRPKEYILVTIPSIQ